MHVLFWFIIISTSMCFAYEFSKICERAMSIICDGLVFVYKHLLQCVNINTVMLRLLQPKMKSLNLTFIDTRSIDDLFFYSTSSWPTRHAEHLCSFNIFSLTRTHTQCKHFLVGNKSTLHKSVIFFSFTSI